MAFIFTFRLCVTGRVPAKFFEVIFLLVCTFRLRHRSRTGEIFRGDIFYSSVLFASASPLGYRRKVSRWFIFYNFFWAAHRLM